MGACSHGNHGNCEECNREAQRDADDLTKQSEKDQLAKLDDKKNQLPYVVNEKISTI